VKIAVNTRLLRKNTLDGIGWFSYNTLRRIVANNPKVEFHFFFDSGIDKDFLFGPNVIPHNLFPPAKHAFLNIWWSEISVKKKLNAIKPDLYFSPDGILCNGWSGQQYGVIHDINFIHHPEFLKLSNRLYYRHYFPKFAHKATRLATVSEYSKNDIVNTFHINPQKIDVVYCGINSFLHDIDEIAASATRANFTDGKPYFLFVGTLSPRKNIIGLMEAYEAFSKETDVEFKLVIAGGGMYKSDEVIKYKQQSAFGNDIVITGRVNNETLNNLYASAYALVFIPFFEGFGIPLVEAMQSKLPIITSSVTSLPEIAGDAALIVDPYNKEEIKDALITITTNSDLRYELIYKGQEQKKLFSWERTADLLWEGINKCLY
jgi:glycosyltransferase involved in cell wall biosynthesis